MYFSFFLFYCFVLNYYEGIPNKKRKQNVS